MGKMGVLTMLPRSCSGSEKLLYVIKEFTRNDKLDGRLKLMKLMFFLEHLDIEKSILVPTRLFCNNEFIIYKYGPFSFKVMKNLEQLKKDGLVDEDSVKGMNGFYKVPRITEKGEEKLDEINHKISHGDIDRVEKIRELFEKQSGKTLEKVSLDYLKIVFEDKEIYIGKSVSEIIEGLT